MHALPWLLGCSLCLASVGAMATTNADTQCADGGAQTAGDATSSHDEGGSSAADLLGLGHSSTRGGGTDSAARTPAADTHSGGGASTSGHARHIGWQSLLPGSIQ